MSGRRLDGRGTASQSAQSACSREGLSTRGQNPGPGGRRSLTKVWVISILSQLISGDNSTGSLRQRIGIWKVCVRLITGNPGGIHDSLKPHGFA